MYNIINNDSITDTLYDTDCDDNHVDNDCFAIDGSSAETEESTSTGIYINQGLIHIGLNSYRILICHKLTITFSRCYMYIILSILIPPAI